MTVRILKTIFLLFPIIMIGAVQETSADYFKYKDSKGTVCITDRLESVPLKCRASVEVIREDALAKKDHFGEKEAEPALLVIDELPAQTPAQEPDASAQAPSRFGELAAKYPWFKPLAIICGFLVSFVIVIKVADLIPSPQVARLLCIAFFLGTFVLAYKAYADHMSSSYLTIKHKIITMFKKANEREGLQPDNKLIEE